jgi:hypothetical protein
MDEQKPNIRFEDFIQQLPEKFSVLQEPVAIEIQMEYFRAATRIRKAGNNQTALDEKDNLFRHDLPMTERKNLLSRLASVADPEAFRAIQKYAAQPDPELKDWSVLALQESRLLLESSLLEEQQVFISTGLGGKGSMLRFFVVFIHPLKALDNLQQKILHDELDYALKNAQGEMESMEHFAAFSSATILMPLTMDMGQVLVSMIDECNQYGGFLEKDFLVTNIKKMNETEIREALTNRPENPDA